MITGAILTWLYEASGAATYAAHAICLNNDPFMKLLFISGNAVIWASYGVMSGIFFYKLWTWDAVLHDGPLTIRFFKKAIMLYGIFISLCGWTHFFSIVTMFYGAYRLEVVVLMLTAGASAVTARYTWAELMGAPADSARALEAQ